MIVHRRRQDSVRIDTGPTSRWAVLDVPPAARAFLVLTEGVAVAVTVLLLIGEPPSSTTMVRFGMLAALGIGYSEVAAHSTRMQRYLGSDKVFTNPMSVWSCAALLTLPAGWAAAFIAVQYAHALWQRRRDASGRPHRVVFTAGAAMLAQLSVAWLFDVAGTDGLGSTTLVSLAALAGVVLFLGVDLALVLTMMWLSAASANLRSLIPDGDAVGYEIGTLVLGLATAEFVLHSPLLTPASLVLVALLHRSSVVKSLQRVARTDSKTGLLTAAAWTDTAAASLATACAAGTGVAVLLIDLDHFKAVNDTRGHLTGDRVLAGVAGCLLRELRGNDGVGRFGGEELIVLLDGPTVSEALAVAHRLRVAVRQLRVDGDLQVTVSVGVAHAGTAPEQLSVEELIESADRALYQAKQAGRDRVRLAALDLAR